MEPHPDDRHLIQGEQPPIDEETLLRHLGNEQSTWLSGDPKSFRVGEREFDTQSTMFEAEGSDSRMVRVLEWSGEHKTYLVAGVFAIGALLYAIRRVQTGRKSK